jgi:uncharacterized membrane protein
MRNNKEIMIDAFHLVKKRLPMTLLMYFIFLGILSISGSFYGVSLILTGPLTIGFIMYLSRVRKNEYTFISDLFDGFDKHFTSSLLAYLVSSVLIILWSFLLIIPGIIKSYSYMMTMYIVKDNPNISPMDAINDSKIMMDGHKMRMFGLFMMSVGWIYAVLLGLVFSINYILPPEVTMNWALWVITKFNIFYLIVFLLIFNVITLYFKLLFEAVKLEFYEDMKGSKKEDDLWVEVKNPDHLL